MFLRILKGGESRVVWDNAMNATCSRYLRLIFRIHLILRVSKLYTSIHQNMQKLQHAASEVTA